MRDQEAGSNQNGVVERAKDSELVYQRGDIDEALIDDSSMDSSSAEGGLLSTEDNSTCSTVDSPVATHESMEMEVCGEGGRDVDREVRTDMKEEGRDKKSERTSTRPRRRAASAAKMKSTHQVCWFFSLKFRGAKPKPHWFFSL